MTSEHLKELRRKRKARIMQPDLWLDSFRKFLLSQHYQQIEDMLKE